MSGGDGSGDGVGGRDTVVDGGGGCCGCAKQHITK